MAWDDELTLEQKLAGSYSGRHACLIGGPGTGKTRVLASRILYLIEERDVNPSAITVLTFTRAAATELRARVAERLGTKALPLISTLHSFALRQLLRNADLVPDIPRPVRIADDWEQRYIVWEDLKRMLGTDIDDVRDRFNLLSADWHDLNADKSDWENWYKDGEFLGAWRRHRTIYGYTLRAELVFRLKRALEQCGDLSLEGAPGFLLVDEYQDLNACDQEVIKAIATRGAEVYAAGDDDQSIYGFRRAFPPGIRNFLQEYESAVRLDLTESKRCDPRILALGQFVAEQDEDRLRKNIRPDHAEPEGEVHILRFTDQHDEAKGVAKLCNYLVRTGLCCPEDILVLVREDYQRRYSSVLAEAFNLVGLPASTGAIEASPIDEVPGRNMVALLRLATDDTDSLAWRTLLQLRRGVGPRRIEEIFKRADVGAVTFAQALREIQLDPSVAGRLGPDIARTADDIVAVIEQTRKVLPSRDQPEELQADESQARILAALKEIAGYLALSSQDASVVVDYLHDMMASAGSTDVEQLLHALAVSSEEMEQERASGKINVMTMHKAKGLTANAVIVVAAEDQLIPGRNEIPPLHKDELRLLYVSLTRARHYLYLTKCEKRLRSQWRTGRRPYGQRRHLTRFLTEGPIHVEDGMEYIESLCGG